MWRLLTFFFSLQLLSGVVSLICNQCISTSCSLGLNCIETVHNYTYHFNHKFKMLDSTWAYNSAQCPKSLLGSEEVRRDWGHSVACDPEQICGHFLVRIERKRVTSAGDMTVPILAGVRVTRVVYFGCVSQVVGSNMVFNEIERERSTKIDEQTQIESRGIVESYGECQTSDFCNDFSTCRECIQMDQVTDEWTDLGEPSKNGGRLPPQPQFTLLIISLLLISFPSNSHITYTPNYYCT